MHRELYQKMSKLLEQVPENRHSYFQLQHFVIGKQPTKQGQMWQCLRELQSRKATIDNLSLAIEETCDHLELLEIKKARLEKNKSCDEIDSREAVIKQRQLDRKRVALERTLVEHQQNIDFAWQEAKFFIKMFDAIEKTEQLKDYDDLEAQKEYWNERISQQITLKLLLQQPLNTELVQTALALHEDAPVRLQTIRTLQQIEGQMNVMKDKYIKLLKMRENNGQTEDNKS